MTDPNDDLMERAVARAIAKVVADETESAQQLPALQFILNRSDVLARAAISAMLRTPPKPASDSAAPRRRASALVRMMKLDALAKLSPGRG